jgi:hypothetical protein
LKYCQGTCYENEAHDKSKPVFVEFDLHVSILITKDNTKTNHQHHFLCVSQTHPEIGSVGN